MSAMSPVQVQPAGSCGITTIAAKRSRLQRIAAGRPTCVCRIPSSPRSPLPCRNRITGQSRSGVKSAGTNTW
jgi:hypothetical protein